MTRILALLTNPLTAGSVLSATACFTAQTGPAEIELIYPRPEIDPDFMPTEDVYTEAAAYILRGGAGSARDAALPNGSDLEPGRIAALATGEGQG